jgi:hypothetical protein
MTEMPALERRYRRLLAWYPAEHRRLNGEEMIGVLLAGARAGQRRPRPSDALDLIRGGLRIRLRSLLSGNLDSKLTDALAIYSIIVPVVLLISGAVWATGTNYRWLRETSNMALWWRLQPLGFESLYLALILLPPILVWRRHRRAAVVLALVPAAFATVGAFRLSATSGVVGDSASSLLLMLQAVALAVSPGPRRGLQLLSKPAWAVVCAAGLAAAVPYTPQTEVFFGMPATEAILVVGGVVVTVLAAMLVTLPARVGFRIISLLAAPVYLYGISLPLYGAPSSLISYSLAIVYLPCLALWVLIGIMAWLGRQRRVRATG